jgi:hypothetical protein
LRSDALDLGGAAKTGHAPVSKKKTPRIAPMAPLRLIAQSPELRITKLLKP